MTENHSLRIEEAELVYRLRTGIDETQPLVIMLHGWTGDEDGMWVFEKVLPETWWLAAMRGLHPLPVGGFSWTADTLDNDPRLSDFTSSVDALVQTMNDVEARFGLIRPQVVLMGFSQRAALAFSVPARTGWKPAAVVSLAGFMPKDAVFDGAGLPVFWGHGIRDEVVSIDLAHHMIARLRAMGAQVEFCEADVAHKTGLACARGLKSWLRRMLAA